MDVKGFGGWLCDSETTGIAYVEHEVGADGDGLRLHGRRCCGVIGAVPRWPPDSRDCYFVIFVSFVTQDGSTGVLTGSSAFADLGRRNVWQPGDH